MQKGGIVFGLMTFVVAVLIFIGIPLALTYSGIMPNYSEGERSGDIYKFSKKGIFVKSWEGEMYLGGANNTQQGLELEKFRFSISGRDEETKKELIEKIKICSQKRTICTIKYNQWLVSPMRIDYQYEVTDVITQ